MSDINKADIVDRMRFIDPSWDMWDATGKHLIKKCGLWCHEAADEIERLRSALNHIKVVCSEDSIPHEIRSFRAMREARAALEEKE